LFVKTEPASPAQFSAVRIDSSGNYPKESFVYDKLNGFDRGSKDAFFRKVVGGVKKLTAPEFPVFINCFVDDIREASAQLGWRMEELIFLVPRELHRRLWQQKPFDTRYPVRFEKNCPFSGIDRNAYAQHEDRWFAWTGTISLRGTTVHVAIDFVHSVVPEWPALWKGESSEVDMYTPKVHDDIAKTIAREWDKYLKWLASTAR